MTAFVIRKSHGLHGENVDYLQMCRYNIIYDNGCSVSLNVNRWLKERVYCLKKEKWKNLYFKLVKTDAFLLKASMKQDAVNCLKEKLDEIK